MYNKLINKCCDKTKGNWQFFGKVILSTAIFIFCTCQNNNPIQNNDKIEMRIISPANNTNYKSKDSVNFVILADTLDALQYLRILYKDSILYGYIIAGYEPGENRFSPWDTTAVINMSAKDTLDSMKIVRLTWIIPDTMYGILNIYYHNFSDTWNGAKVTIIVTNK